MKQHPAVFRLLVLAVTGCGLHPCLAGDGLPRGCHEMPYLRFEAEAGQSAGGAVSRTAFDFDAANTASEASNRHYIGLPVNGASVQWTVSKVADGVTLRFTLPDNAAGTGVAGSLDILVNNTLTTTVQLGSYWAWTYFETPDPQNAPGAKPRMRFDEIRFRLPAKLQPGDVLKIVKTNGDAYEYGIDFIEIENVPDALTKPAGFVSVADHGAIGTDELADSNAFDAAWQAAKTAGSGLYIPPGKYVLNRRWNLGNSTDLSIQGAGIWQTELFFSNKVTGGGGILTGKHTTGIEISHCYMNSALNERHIVPGEVADFKAFNGPFGNGSNIHNMWMTHFEVGAWLADYTSPVKVTTGLDFSNNRVRGMYADGINFAQGTSNCVVRQCDFRSCGDDALAIWTSNASGAPEGHGNVFHHNTVEFTYRAAGVAIFGGYGHEVHHCIIKDGTDSSGIRFTEDFSGYHFQNNRSIRIYENTLIAQGTSQDLWNNPRGAIEIYGAGIQFLDFDDNDILNSPRHAIQLGGGHDLSFTNTTISQTGLDNFSSPRGAAIHQYGPAGSAAFVNLDLTEIENDPAVIHGNPAYALTIYDVLEPSPYEMEIRFTGYDRPTALNQFPVLVKLDSTRAGFSYNQFVSPAGNDLRFRDADHRELKYEIESWNPGGTSWVWVQVPELHSNTSVWAAWGAASHAVKPAYSSDGSTWTNGYAAVYHANGGAGIRRDSSMNLRHGTPLGNTATVAGMVAGADEFDGSGDLVRLPSNFGVFDGSKEVTVEFWFKADAVAPGSAWQTSPVLFEARAENQWMLTFGDSMAPNALSPRLDQGGWNTPASAPGILTNQWYHFAATYAPSGSNNWKVYLDGMMVSQGTRTGAVASLLLEHNQYGGSDEAGTTRWFNGLMDEVRVSTQARSADWMWATWRNVTANETFATYGAVTEVGPRHALVINADAGGMVTGSPPGNYVPGTSASVGAIANPYYHFHRWTGDVTEEQALANPLTLLMDQPRVIRATFQQNLTSGGVPEWWLAQHGWTTDFETASLADGDGDGQAAAREYIAGTNPTDPSSVFRAQIDSPPNTAGFQVSWSSVANKTYRIERSDHPAGPWQTASSGITATPPVNHLTLPTGGARGFIRIAVE